LHILVRFLIIISNLFLLIALLSTSCAHFQSHRLPTPLDIHNLHKTVYIADSFTPQEEDAIINALKSWECSTNYLISFNIQLHAKPIDYLRLEETRDLAILKVNGDNQLIQEADQRTKNDSPDKKRFTVGLYVDGKENGINQILMVGDRLNKQDWYYTALHEIGHALYLDHSKDQNSIMYRHLDVGSKKITQKDLHSLCNLYWCDDEKMKACN